MTRLSLLALLLLTACAPVATNAGVMPVMATQRASSTSAPTWTTIPTATPDLQLAATGTAISYRITDEALDRAYVVLSITQSAATLTAVCPTQTAIARTAEAQDARIATLTAYPAMATSTTLAITEREAEITRAAKVGNGIQAILWALAIVAVIAAYQGTHLVVAEWHRRNDVQPEEPAPIAPTINRMQPVTAQQFSFRPCPIDHETLVKVVAILQAGQGYTVANMTGDGKPLSRSTFAQFGAWLVSCGYAVRNPATGQYEIQRGAVEDMAARVGM